MKDHYKNLGVDRNATQEEIRKAYISLLKKYHPDNNPLEDTTSTMQDITKSYEILSNEQTRRDYDISLESQYNTTIFPKYEKEDKEEEARRKKYEEEKKDIAKNLQRMHESLYEDKNERMKKYQKIQQERANRIQKEVQMQQEKRKERTNMYSKRTTTKENVKNMNMNWNVINKVFNTKKNDIDRIFDSDGIFDNSSDIFNKMNRM